MSLNTIIYKNPKRKSVDKFIPLDNPRMSFMESVEEVKNIYKDALDYLSKVG